MLEERLDIFYIILDSGPVVKGVLLLLLGASVLSWAIIFKKYVSYKMMKRQNREFLSCLEQSSSLTEVVINTEHLQQGLYRNIFFEGHRELEKIQSKKSSENDLRESRMESLKRAMKKGVYKNNLQLNQLMSILASVGSISPFIGLFGTVWGIIDSFTGLASGGSSLDAVAPGIAEALVATAIGLAAAIPAVAFYNHFSNKNIEFGIEMEIFEQEFLNIVERSLIGK